MSNKPNVVFIYADDLGRGMLSCYGQKYLKTPNIDKLYEGGMSFSNAHGCHICAPARASLMCGVHDTHCGRWHFTRAGIYKDVAKGDITLEQAYELIQKTGFEERSGEVYLPMVFKQAGYTTGQIGKLEWGFATTGDAIKAHGWDYHYGYYDHEMCHGFYPPFMFEDGQKIDIEGNTDVHCGADQFSRTTFTKNGDDIENGRAVYSQDLFDEKIDDYLRKNKDKPFFLFHPTQLPHGQLSIPEISPLVINNEELTFTEKLYASMVIRMDDCVGKIMDTLEELGIMDNTMIVFGADNGHCCYSSAERTGRSPMTVEGGAHVDNLNVRGNSEAIGDIFNGNNGMTGYKSSNFEGGTRVPLIFYQRNKIKHGVSDRLIANYDFMATMADMLDTNQGDNKDGKSYLRSVTGECKRDEEQDYIVYASERGPAIVTKDGFKLRSYITDNFKFFRLFGAFWKEIEGDIVFELYNLNDDYTEENNLIEKYPEKADKMKSILVRECDGNLIHGLTQMHFAYYGYDYHNNGIRE